MRSIIAISISITASRCMLLMAFVLNAFLLPAQNPSKTHVFSPLNRWITYEFERSFFEENDSSLHTGIKPFLLRADEQMRPLAKELEDDTSGSGILKRKFFTHHLIRTKGPNIDPLIAIQPGYDLKTRTNTMRLEAGAQLTHKIARRASNDSYYYKIAWLGGLSTYPAYLDSIIDSLNIIPGMGRAYHSSKGKYSYQQFAASFSYSPNEVFNFQLGHDKNSWGEGYRSLFLSDVSNNYPFLKITSSIWRLKYVNLYARFNDFGTTALKKDLLPKYGTFHYLSYNATKWLNISLFEAIMWQGSDTNRTRNFDINYLNPVIFFRPVEYSLGSSDNALVGGSMKVKIKRVHLYGQLLLDEFLLKEIRANRGWWGNKYGYQAGVKAFDLFRIKDLYFQAEYNTVRPYTYTHGTVRQSYTHFNQPHAHPLGANFKEAVAFLSYRHKRLLMEGKLLYAEYGRDSLNTNYGHNLLLSYATRPFEYGHFTGQGIASKLAVADLRMAYVLNPKYNLLAELRLSTRITRSILENKNFPFVQLGIKTDLFNLYDDF